MKLPKEHYFDAVTIATEGKGARFQTHQVLFKTCVSDGDYQQTKDVRSEQVIPTGKLFGFIKFHKVQYKGNEYFIYRRSRQLAAQIRAAFSFSHCSKNFNSKNSFNV
ncbi:hypothetical protein [Ectobacillus funiculus]|uniref:Uncharacterized protein n=1 Tax=Ectobacillus funiculus TaxID=137993 RepID=A0ABV5WIQ1_9BACI